MVSLQFFWSEVEYATDIIDLADKTIRRAKEGCDKESKDLNNKNYCQAQPHAFTIILFWLGILEESAEGIVRSSLSGLPINFQAPAFHPFRPSLLAHRVHGLPFTFDRIWDVSSKSIIVKTRCQNARIDLWADNMRLRAWRATTIHGISKKNRFDFVLRFLMNLFQALDDQTTKEQLDEIRKHWHFELRTITFDQLSYLRKKMDF